MSDRAFTLDKPVDLGALTRELRALDPSFAGCSLNGTADLVIHGIGDTVVVTDTQIAAVLAAHTPPTKQKEPRDKAKDAIATALAGKKTEDILQALAAIRDVL